MNILKFQLALISGKIVYFLTNVLGRGGGTAAPGLITLKIYPDFIKDYFSQNHLKTIVITGTNGKTTTARMLSSILTQTGFNLLHNRAGSNLLRGVASAIIKNSNLLGRSPEFDYAILETDEFALDGVIKNVNPDLILITNLFRDQLDRYGEIDTIRKNWEKSLENLPPSTTLILNADDPSVAFLANKFKGPRLYFGLDDPSLAQNQTSQAADSRNCLKCGQPLSYQRCYFSHLGFYSCPQCDFKRPKTQITGSNLKISGLEGISGTVKPEYSSFELNLNVPGLFNFYNALAATSIAHVLNIPQTDITDSLKNFQTDFGRQEKLTIDGKNVYLFLVKNPTGFNEVLRTIFEQNFTPNLLIAINDLTADGHDISWLWDVNFEQIKNKTKKITVSGLRANDMSLRLKYAGINNFFTQDNLKEALNQSLINLNNKDTLFILPTYTAMLEIQKILREKKLKGKYWQE